MLRAPTRTALIAYDEQVSKLIPWPPGFQRIPEGEWTAKPIDELAMGYDTVEHHGWYRNLEPTVKVLEKTLSDGRILMDYSGGTGILADRLLRRLAGVSFGILIVDSSPKFLRLAIDKVGSDERTAFRLIRFLRDERRLQLVDEVLDPSLLARGIDALVSTNAIHLYYDLPDTLASWHRVLRPGGMVHVQSGNIRNPAADEDEWIIDETVTAIHEAAMEIVRVDDRFAAYRPPLEDRQRMARYDTLRKKIFLPVRPLDHYVAALEDAGFTRVAASKVTIDARVVEWRSFLRVYHEGVLGWIGGIEKIDGRPPSAQAVQDRLALLDRAVEKVFSGRETFRACWTYIDCRRPS